MAEFMEQRHDIVVRQQRQSVVIHGRKIADEVPDRKRRFATEVLTANTFVDPCAAAFAVAGIDIGVETTDDLVRLVANSKVACILMPDLDVIKLNKLDAVEFGGQCKQPVDNRA